MPPDHNQQHSRRPHYHRGRRGPDRRGGDRRPPQSQPQEPANRDHLDVEQIMRDIRSRISERHGIDLSAQQIQELAARRLEAILDPRTIKPSLMDELRRAAGLPADTPPSEPDADATVTEDVLYKSNSGFMRVIRRLLNPLLKLFFNPAAIVDAINTQSAKANAAAKREAELRRRQTEWNALHFEILRRLVTDIARVEIDNQHLAHRVESLSARVDFNERRVRGMEHTQQQARPGSSRPQEPAVVSSPSPSPSPAAREETQTAEHAASDASLPEGGRRRRRRRRGRRSGQPREIIGAPAAGAVGTAVAENAEGDEFDDDAMADDVIEEASAAAVADDRPVEPSPPPAFEPPALPSPFESLPSSPVDFEAPAVPAESLHVVSEPETVPAAPESSPASPEETVERHDPVPPERS
jgi:hypothetical protein